MDYTKHLLLDDIKVHSELFRYGVYKTSTFGRLTTTFRMIQVQIIQISSTLRKKTDIYYPNLNDILQHQQIICFLSPTLPVLLDYAVPYEVRYLVNICKPSIGANAVTVCDYT